MEESQSNFPFRKLRYHTYLTLEVMLHVEHLVAYKVMFSVNKETRRFLQKHSILIQNGFINEGLITYNLFYDFNHYEQLEKLYL